MTPIDWEHPDSPVSVKESIIDKLAEGKFISDICMELSVPMTLVRQWLQKDELFATAYNDAVSIQTDLLEKEAIRRARDGYQEPVVSKGEVVYDADGEPLMVTRYSDSLMMGLLKGRRPDVYGDKREIKGSVGINVDGAKAALAQKFASIIQASEESSGS
jgi:hypothetical protein